MQKTIIILTAFLNLMVSCGPSAGRRGEGVSDEISPGTGLLESWPREGPELLWIYEGLGKGYGGPLITDEAIYINAEDSGNSFTLCLDLKGKFRWKTPNGTEFLGSDFTASYPGTRSAPASKGNKVYAISGTGHMSCFDWHSGKVIWKVDLVKDLGGIPGEFGYSESPVVDEDRVYCFAGGKVNNIVALDRHTGKLAWSSRANQDYFSYGTPILLKLPECDVLAGTSRHYIHVVDRKDGQLLSSYTLEDIKVGYEHCNSVLYRDGYLYFIPSEEHGQGSIKLHLSADGKSLREVWRNEKVVNVFEGFVVSGGFLYTTLEKRKLVAIDTESGLTRYTVPAVSGSIVYADRKLFVYGHNGRVQLFSIGEGKPDLKSEMRIIHGDGQHFSFPVIAGGVMYIRRGNALMAFSLK